MHRFGVPLSTQGMLKNMSLEAHRDYALTWDLKMLKTRLWSALGVYLPPWDLEMFGNLNLGRLPGVIF